MIVIGNLSGPELALVAEAQQVVLEYLAKQTDWSEEDRQAVMAIFEKVSQK